MNDYRVSLDGTEHAIQAESLLSDGKLLSFHHSGKLVAQFVRWDYWCRVVNSPEAKPSVTENATVPAKSEPVGQ